MNSPAESRDGKPNGPADVLVADFLQRSYRPQRLPGKPWRRYQEAITWLERFLKRPAALADLTASNLFEIQKFMASCRLGPVRVREVKKLLSSLAKHAWRLGLIPEWNSISTRKGSTPRRIAKDNAFLKQPPGPGTLAAIFCDRLKPQLVAQGRNFRTFNNHTTAIRQFDRLLGRYATPADVTPENLAAFRAALLEGGRSEKLVRQYKVYLRRTARQHNPEGFPDGRRTVVPPSPPEPGTLRAYFATDYRPARLVGGSKSHLRDFGQTFRFLHAYLGRDVRVDELTDALVADFLSWLLEKKGMRAITVNSHRFRVLAIWRFAVERNLLPRDPRVRKLREEVDTPDSWNIDEIARLIAAPEKVTWRRQIAGIPAAKFFRALLLVAYWTGLRRGSLFAIRRCDINLATRWLTVPGKAMKNRQGQAIRLGEDAIAAIAEIWEPKRELLFPWPYSMSWFAECWKRIFDASGLEPSTRRTMGALHKMRRSVATMTAASRGQAAACELLGHSSSEVTKRYIDPSKIPGSDATEWLPVATGGQPASSPAAPTGTVKHDPHTWLAEAHELFRLGSHTAAAMTARVATEALLHARVKSLRIRPRPKRGLRSEAVALRDRGEIDQAAFLRLKDLATVMNDAARGQLVTAPQVAGLLAGVNEIFAAIASKPETRDHA